MDVCPTLTDQTPLFAAFALMRRFFLFVERLSLSAWLGMGIMFLTLLLSLRGSSLFSPETKDDHPRVLFPAYYTLEFLMLGPAAVAGLLARGIGTAHSAGSIQPGRHARPRWPLALTLVALGLALVDYFVIYRPLAEMLGRPPYPPRFQSLHETSR